jgi:hypothetical protein
VIETKKPVAVRTATPNSGVIPWFRDVADSDADSTAYPDRLVVTVIVRDVFGSRPLTVTRPLESIESKVCPEEPL